MKKQPLQDPYEVYLVLEGSRWLTRLLDVLWHCVQFEWGSIGADVRYDTDLKRRKKTKQGKLLHP